ncbi:hypothetical protein IVB46_02650 [Bradyrhizobium sp. 61]|uniref:hypothetical protein n=1 Tax=Bradyrhizobium sp. 61 TaxID=2782679 RepID=UPI001FFA3D55|nr:hypothetical protein [Bradyrhizobium sp. 61]MCK1274140.1 hypothetical protein [Bradyrhizobium sp. 61]
MSYATHDNDNEEFSFISLAAATANVVRYLESSEDHHPDSKRDASEDDNERKKTADHRKAVEQGLRNIERFESRYRRADRS